jgi:hypothetical protein
MGRGSCLQIRRALGEDVLFGLLGSVSRELARGLKIVLAKKLCSSEGMIPYL